MGRNAGFIALNTGIGSGAGNILIPESKKNIDTLIDFLKKGIKRNKLFNLVIVAEGNKNGGATEIAQMVKEKFDYYDTKVTIIGHLQRGGSPTAMDRVLASQLGFNAVEVLLEGEENVMVGIKDNKLVCTPFAEAIKKAKKLDKNMMKMAEILAL